MNGVVLKRTVVHKKMRSDMENPKILLLGFPIEYYRVENQLASFDILLEQEQDYLKLLVARIAEKKPDIVLVEKYASRLVQEMLLEQRISLLVNVRTANLQSISRATGCPIVSSIG